MCVCVLSRELRVIVLRIRVRVRVKGSQPANNENRFVSVRVLNIHNVDESACLQ